MKSHPIHYLRKVEVRRQGEAVAAYHGRVSQAYAHYLRTLGQEKVERRNRITARRWRLMKPLVEAFAKEPSKDAAEELLAIDESYTQALASDQLTTP